MSVRQARQVTGGAAMIAALRKGTDGHKYSHGHALILAGPLGRGGAARLAARGALRIGAGVVTVGCPPDALGEHAGRLNAVMLREVADAPALAELLKDSRINALCLGPGLGLGPREAELIALALGRTGHGSAEQAATKVQIPEDEAATPSFGQITTRAVVLDADALTLLASRADLFGALHKECVLTPHAGEFARLFPDLAAKLAASQAPGASPDRIQLSKEAATIEAAARSGCVVVFKGRETVIADPMGRSAVTSASQGRSAAWLATAGSGDVLAGFITGLLARGFSPYDAACTGAWLHLQAALSFGPGLIAEDLPEELPKVFRALGL